MGVRDERLKPFVAGTRPSAAHLTALANAINTCIGAGFAHAFQSPALMASRQLFSASDALPQQLVPIPFIVTSHGNDHLVGKLTDAAGNLLADDAFFLAKPPSLQRSRFDGVTRNGFSYVYSSASERVSTKVSDSTTENQEIVDAYVVRDANYVGDVVYAVLVAATGLWVSPAGTVSDAPSESASPLVWMDNNVHGRHFGWV